MQRYFVDIINNKVIFSKDDIHHIVHVMRMKVNDTMELVSGDKAYEGRIVSLTPFNVDIIKTIDCNSELPNSLTLFFALAKGDKMDLVIQKATELGASRIVFLSTKRSVVHLNNDDFKKKLVRFEKIAKEASEQSHRLRIPSIYGLFDIKSIPDDFLEDVNFVAYENLASTSSPDLSFLKDQSVSFLVGSEGGLTQDEINVLVNKGFKSVSLGKRILRCETAAIYGLSVIAYLFER